MKDALKDEPGRNERCWCGSGEKYKRCHLSREKERPLVLQEAFDLLRRGMDYRVCLHPQAGPGACAGPIIDAHTVQRVGSLSQIAFNGRVLQLGPAQARNGDDAPRFDAKPVGYRKASTIPAFCDRHDKVFGPVENQPFRATREQAFLLGYRAWAYEYHRKDGVLRNLPVMRQVDRGRDPAMQRQLQSLIDLMQAGTELGVRDLKACKAEYDDVLVSGDFRASRSVTFMLDRPPVLMCSGATTLEFDLEGRSIQDISDHDVRAHGLSFSLVGTKDGRGAAVFQWLGDSKPHTAMSESLRRIPLADAPDILIRFALEHLENVYLSPIWWGALAPEVQRALLKRAESGLPGRERTARSMADDGIRTNAFAVTELIAQN